jgi:hypothetical protein
MTVTINGTTGITNDGGYTGDGVVFADTTPSNTLVTTTGGNVGIGTSSPGAKLEVAGLIRLSTNPSDPGTNDASIYNASGIGPTISGNAIAFRTQLAERARIDSSGNLLVGRTSASLGSGTGVQIYPNGLLEVGNADSTNNSVGLRQYSSGAGAYRFFVGYGGTIYATSTSITAISDQSLKDNIRDLDTGLSEVLALKPRRFDWKEETQLDEKNVAGFIAQEVAEVLPELVYDYQYNQNTVKKGLKMGDILPTLVKAIQEQQALIASQSAIINAQQAALTALTARVEALEGQP